MILDPTCSGPGTASFLHLLHGALLLLLHFHWSGVPLWAVHFHKYPYSANFEFAAKFDRENAFKTKRGSYRLKVVSGADDIYHLQIVGKGWERNESQAGLRLRKGSAKSAQTQLHIARDTGITLKNIEGDTLLSGISQRFFGQCGEASIFQFNREPGSQFYGLGEKWTGFEHSGKTTKFWNTDVWGDFPASAFIEGKPIPDPVYVSIPYLIIKRENTYLGLLLDNPYATFISTGTKTSIANQLDVAGSTGNILLGAEQGQPNLYLIYGPSLADVTRKVQRLIGTTPLPPAWALGCHQCRWGYQSESDLKDLDQNFRKHGIPVDGLWLDIDYMDHYKVFTFAKKHFPNPKKALAHFESQGRKVVPIFDPGIKVEKGYPVYERGRKARAFCENPQGREYVGLVWPGDSAFPDFSTVSGRNWWAKEVADFVSAGIPGAWLDMNDPSTGPSENEDMLFDHGTKSHSSFHNQYALGMAMASRQGFLKARPKERPFLLSRSGFTGSNRYTAIWTGDNYSNFFHLKNSIPTTLNLALSGIPFNGPDAGGFGGNTTAELMIAWYKAGFLFPFFRNHSIANSRQQEPWAFDKKTMQLLRHYMQLRYRLRPYLYQLFAQHEESGEAILRPLFYDFPDTQELPLGLIDDQFMVGPAIMQAPFVNENPTTREVVLPNPARWYATMDNRWYEGGQKLSFTFQANTTPLFIRDATIIPLARLKPEENVFDAAKIDFHLFLSDTGKTTLRYVFDDGATFAYQEDKRSEIELEAERSKNSIQITLKSLRSGYGNGDFTFTTSAEIEKVSVNGKAARPCRSQGVPLIASAKTWSLR